MNHTIRIGVNCYLPYVHPCVLAPRITGHCIKHAGSQLAPLLVVLESLNIKWTIVSTNVTGCGSVTVSNGVTKSDGLTYMLEHGDIDITGNACRMSEDRHNLVDFVQPLFYATPVFVSRRREVHSTAIGSIIAPFSLDIWICCAVTFVIYWVVIALTKRKLRFWSLLLQLIEQVESGSYGNLSTTPQLPSAKFAEYMWYWTAKGLSMMYLVKVTSIYVFTAHVTLQTESIENIARDVESGKVRMINRSPNLLIHSRKDIQSKIDTGIGKFNMFVDRRGGGYIFDKILDDYMEYLYVDSDTFIYDEVVRYDRAAKLAIVPASGYSTAMYGHAFRKDYTFNDRDIILAGLSNTFATSQNFARMFYPDNKERVIANNQHDLNTLRQSITIDQISGLLLVYCALCLTSIIGIFVEIRYFKGRYIILSITVRNSDRAHHYDSVTHVSG